MASDKIVVLALPTPHDVHSPLKKQYSANIDLEILSTKGMVELSDSGIRGLTKELAKGINNMLIRHPGAKQVDMIITGLPVANMIANMLFREKDIIVNFLIWDTRKRKYYRVNGRELRENVMAPRWSG